VLGLCHSSSMLGKDLGKLQVGKLVSQVNFQNNLRIFEIPVLVYCIWNRPLADIPVDSLPLTQSLPSFPEISWNHDANIYPKVWIVFWPRKFKANPYLRNNFGRTPYEMRDGHGLGPLYAWFFSLASMICKRYCLHRNSVLIIDNIC